jgi:hypothetical protein
MCEPITIGILTAASGAMSAIGQHQAQQAAVQRQNQIAQQQYQNQLRIAEQQDRAKKEKHSADLAAQAQAVTDALKQHNVNQIEADRAMMAASRAKKEKMTEAAFEQEAAVASAIQATGQMLSTGNAGQSFLLQTLQTERELGQQTAAIEQTLYDANAAFHTEAYGIQLQQYGANAKVNNAVPATPVAPGASFIPYKPIKARGPSGLALAGNLMGAAMGGVSAGMNFQSAMDNAAIKGTLTKQPAYNSASRIP